MTAPDGAEFSRDWSDAVLSELPSFFSPEDLAFVADPILLGAGTDQARAADCIDARRDVAWAFAESSTAWSWALLGDEPRVVVTVVGTVVGAPVGIVDATVVGTVVGAPVGIVDATVVGTVVGAPVGTVVATVVGTVVGTGTVPPLTTSK